MGRFISRRPSPAMVVACLALGVAITGNAGAIMKPEVPTIVEVKAAGSVARGSVGSATAECPQGYSALGGGWVLRTGNIAMPVNAFPTKDHRAYTVTFLVPPTAVGAPTRNATFAVKVVCAKTGVPVVLP